VVHWNGSPRIRRQAPLKFGRRIRSVEPKRDRKLTLKNAFFVPKLQTDRHAAKSGSQPQVEYARTRSPEAQLPIFVSFR